MEKLFFSLNIIFAILTFIGAWYVLKNNGTVSAGYAVIPMIFSLVFFMFFQISKSKIKK